MDEVTGLKQIGFILALSSGIKHLKKEGFDAETVLNAIDKAVNIFIEENEEMRDGTKVSDSLDEWCAEKCRNLKNAMEK